MKEPPRLTTALRAFAHLSIPYERPSAEEYKEMLAKKMKQRAAKQAAAESLQWSELFDTLKTKASKAERQETVTASLRELLRKTKLIGIDNCFTKLFCCI